MVLDVGGKRRKKQKTKATEAASIKDGKAKKKIDGLTNFFSFLNSWESNSKPKTILYNFTKSINF